MKKIYVIVLNIGYWLFLIILLAMLYAALQINANSPSVFNVFVLVCGYIITPSLVSFYGSYFFLFHLFIKKVSKGAFAISTILLLLVSISISLVLVSIYSLVEKPRVFFEIGIVSLMLSGFNVLSGFILQSFISWFKDLKEKEVLNQKTKILELEMLKLKLDPHFLFNTINNIDVLIEENSKKASEYIIKLSSILRFYLYNTSDSMIKLSDEIMYIQEYVDLQKIRTTNESFVNLAIEGKAEGKEIAPMVFIPFIENAFKHSQNKKTDIIDIQISIIDKDVYFKCKNSLHITEKESKGIGNKLIENRLKLIYGNTYELKKNITEEDYIIELKIPI